MYPRILSCNLVTIAIVFKYIKKIEQKAVFCLQLYHLLVNILFELVAHSEELVCISDNESGGLNRNTHSGLLMINTSAWIVQLYSACVRSTSENEKKDLTIIG